MAAAVPLVLTTKVSQSATSKDLKSEERTSPAYLVVLTGKSKRCTSGEPRIASVVHDKDQALRLAAKLRRRPNFDSYVVTVAKGGAA